MPNLPVQVYIVDDEPSFESLEEFVHADLPDENACVISDVRMPGTSGLELPALLARAGRHLPVIFITAHDTHETLDMARRAAYFHKPVDDQALLRRGRVGSQPRSDNQHP